MSQVDEKTPEKRINVGLPVSTHTRVAKVAEKTHRTIVGLISYMTEQMERELGFAPANQQANDHIEQPQTSLSANG